MKSWEERTWVGAGPMERGEGRRRSPGKDMRPVPWKAFLCWDLAVI